MDSTQTALAAAVALAFILQGGSCWRRSHASSYRRSLAILTILLAALGLSAHFLLASGAMVVSSEFGIVMVQGTAAWVALLVVLIGLPVAAAVGAHVSRKLAGFPGCARWSVPAAVLVGALAAWRVEPLGASVELPAPLRAYDLWWPVFLLWIVYCGMEALRAGGRVQRRAAGALAAAGLTMLFSLWALRRYKRGLAFADPLSAELWDLTLYASAGATLAIAVGLITARRWAVAAAGLAGAISVHLWIIDTPIPVLLRPWILGPLALLALAVARAGWIRRMWGTEGYRMADFGRPGRGDDAIAAGALVVAAICVADALYFRRFGAVFDLVFALLAWAVFVEVISVGPLAAVFGRPVRETLSAVRATAARAVETGGSAAGALTRPILDGVKWFVDFEKVGAGIFRTVLLIFLLVAIAEVRHAGKTVIVPFTELGLTGDEERHFGRMISNRAVNLFGTLTSDLEPEVAILVPSADGARDPRQSLDLVAPGDAADRPEAVVSGELEIGGVSVPVGIVTGWVQTPVRWLFGVRVVTGTVQKDGGGYLLLAHTSDGEAFRVQYAGPDAGGEATAGTLDRTAAAERLAEELAYKLITSLPEMARAGMTRSWQAAQPYAKGLAAWKQFETDNQAYDALTSAIASFQEALRIDPSFALGHYRMGLALMRDQRPFAATEFLRRSIQTNPNFALGYDALASHLYFNLPEYYTRLSAGPETISVAALQREEANERQARILWRRLLQFPGRQVPGVALANAHSGLCQMVFWNATPDQPGRWPPAFVRLYVGSFHCRRALQLYAQLPPDLRESATVRTAEGTTWMLAGDLLHQAVWTWADSVDQTWHCAADSISEIENGRVRSWRVGTSRYAADALPYYRRAVALLPDDADARCRLANAALALGDPGPMRELEASAAAHASLAGSLWGRSPSWDSEYFRLAEDEYVAAFELDPQDVYARNDFAYRLWRWHLQAVRAGVDPLPRRIVEAAERHIREAARLAPTVARRADQAAIRSTLGEVLLMQGRAHEAYRELERGMELALAHPRFDEIRWELAFAYLCAAATDRRAGRAAKDEADLEARATKLLDQIRAHNEGREIRSLPDDLPLDRHAVAALCAPGPGEIAPDAAPADDMLYELRTGAPRIASYPPCEAIGVAAFVAGEESGTAPRLRLRVFGLDLHPNAGLFPLSAAIPSQPFLLLPKQTSHDLYFAQLERVEDGKVLQVSPVYPIETSASAACRANGVMLEFGRRAPKKPGVGPPPR